MKYIRFEFHLESFKCSRNCFLKVIIPKITVPIRLVDLFQATPALFDVIASWPETLHYITGFEALLQNHVGSWTPEIVVQNKCRLYRNKLAFINDVIIKFLTFNESFVTLGWARMRQRA